MAPTRAHPRFAVEIDADIIHDRTSTPARTRNVSQGGLCVVVPHPVTVGADVVVSLSLVFDERAVSEALPLRGRVVWCTRLVGEQHQLGATFVGLTGEQRENLELFLRYLKDG